MICKIEVEFNLLYPDYLFSFGEPLCKVSAAFSINIRDLIFKNATKFYLDDWD